MTSDRAEHSGKRSPLSLMRTAQRLPPGAFSFVMATAIVSSAIHLVEPSVLSDSLLWTATAGAAAVLVLLGLRVVRFPRDLLADARDAERSFGFFTVVAALNVLAVQFDLAGHVDTALVLAALSVPIWLVIGYAIPAGFMLGADTRPVVNGVNGSWFMWVVATQSLVVAATAITADRPGLLPALAPVAVGLWGVGVVLYITLVGLVTQRLLSQPSNPRTFSPSYWIYMGATAITVLAGSHLIRLPPTRHVLQVTDEVIAGATYLLWAFGTWWIPLLLLFGVWRHGLQREPLRYEAGLWSMVFPLGMYAVASIHFGQARDLPFMVTIGRWETWVAFAAWVLVTLGMLATAARTLRQPVMRQDPPR